MCAIFFFLEVYEVKGKRVRRFKKHAAGRLMATWRRLRDEGDDEMKRFFEEVEVYQQPAAFADSVIVSWMTEMRKVKDGYSRSISVRDMFAGGLSQSTRRMSFICDSLLTFIGGKMTPVMQVTDVGVAFNLKKHIETAKVELRREKRGQNFEEIPYEKLKPEEVSTCGAKKQPNEIFG